MADLTPKQKRFVEEYLIDLNATQAAIRAGYSKKTAEVIGHENLRKPKIAEAIQKAKEERSKRTEITADRVLEEYAKLAFADIKDFVSFRTEKVFIEHDEDGQPIFDYRTIVEIKESALVDGAVISEISIKDGKLKFKLHDKKGALDALGKHLGMFKTQLELSKDIVVQFTKPDDA